MLLKTLNIALGALVGFTVWCAVATLALLVARVAFNVAIIGGCTLYRLMHL